MGNEIVSVAQKPDKKTEKPSTNELLGLLDNMIKSYEDLPSFAMTSAINNYDMLSSLLLVRSLVSALASDISLIKESIEATVEESI